MRYFMAALAVLTCPCRRREDTMTSETLLTFLIGLAAVETVVPK